MNYDANSIQQLSFREGCRQRIGIYLGSADNEGVLAGLLELVNNATDEAIVCKDANEIELHIGKDWASCRDYGRGMPHGKNDFTNEVMINLLTENHSGAKFNDSAYGGKSRGLNGTGSAATCCSSDWFEISSYRDGYEWYMKFEEGIPLFNECQKKDIKNNRQGTYIKYKPSQAVFKAEKIHFDYDYICKKIKEYSFFNKGILFKVINEDTGEKKEFISQNGLLDFAKEKISNPIHKKPLHYIGMENDIDIELILQWTTDKEKFYLFSNGGENPQGGTPITGIKTSLTNFFKKYLKNINPDLARNGLVTFCSINLKNPIYNGQTKEKITNPELRGLAQRVTNQLLDNFSKTSEFEKLISIIEKQNKAAQAAERAKEAILNANRETEKARKNNVIDVKKLNDAEKLGENAILLCVEGKSAASNIRKARDPKKYGVLQLRGKIINALSNDIEDVLKNEEVKLLLKATGINISDYSKSRLRYGKIGICVDADDDGRHIACLIMALLYKVAPGFLKENRLVWLHAPLYKVTKKGKNYYYYSDEELLSGEKGEQIHFKGLGEMDDISDNKVMFDPDTQRLETLYWSDDFPKVIENLMGEDSTPKKDFVFNKIDFEKYGEI